jgi:hypothetical protein
MQQLAKNTNLFIMLFLFSLITRLPLVSHPVNFSPLDTIALFCGAYATRYITAIFITLITIWLSDIFITKMLLGEWLFFYHGFYWQYASYALITLLGTGLSTRMNPFRLIATCLSASILFFVISNAGVWYSGTLYPHTSNGLFACYVAAIPFFKNTLISDLFFSAVIFGCYFPYRSRNAKLISNTLTISSPANPSNGENDFSFNNCKIS